MTIPDWTAGQPHTCRVFNRLRSRGKARKHARRCTTCRRFFEQLTRSTP